MNLLKGIRAVINKENFDLATQKEIKLAQEINKRANIQSIGQIQFRGITNRVNSAQTAVHQPLEEQRPKNLIEELSIKYIGGLSSNFVYPILKGSASQWAAETSTVGGDYTLFDSVKLTPRRLASYVAYSREVILNPSVGVEEAIEQDLMNSVFEKVQETMFNECYDSAHTKTISGYSDIVDLEYSAASQNISNAVYVVSPLAAKALKQMMNGNTPIYNNGMINGVKVYETPSLTDNKIIYGDFSKLLLGQFGAIDVTVDHVTRAKEGLVQLIFNSYWDFSKLGNDGFVFGTIAEEEPTPTEEAEPTNNEGTEPTNNEDNNEGNNEGTEPTE